MRRQRFTRWQAQDGAPMLHCRRAPGTATADFVAIRLDHGMPWHEVIGKAWRDREQLVVACSRKERDLTLEEAIALAAFVDANIAAWRRSRGRR